jgi:hypothetical protein
MWIGLWSTLAFAGGWDSFKAAFPELPCQDGWASCGMGSDRVTPDLEKDADGRPMVADMRMSFWSFEPAKGFSPFVTLTKYATVASIEPTTPVVPEVVAEHDTDVKQAAIVPKHVDPPKKETLVAENDHGVVKQEVVQPQVEVLAPKTTPAGTCDNLPVLEPRALLGKLDPAEITCLEGRYATASQTDKDKVSRVLMADTFARGDKKGWEKLVARHLDEVDQSDPELVYRYASALAKSGRDDGAIRWADVALENKTRWTGDKFVERVNALYRLKTAAAQNIWKKAEDTAIADPTKQPDVEKARARTKVFAREWLSYARASGQDTTTAAQMCAAAAGTSDYCQN